MVTDNLGLLVHRECQFSTLTANTDNERATEKKTHWIDSWNLGAEAFDSRKGQLFKFCVYFWECFLQIQKMGPCEDLQTLFVWSRWVKKSWCGQPKPLLLKRISRVGFHGLTSLRESKYPCRLCCFCVLCCLEFILVAEKKQAMAEEDDVMKESSRDTKPFQTSNLFGDIQSQQRRGSHGSRGEWRLSWRRRRCWSWMGGWDESILGAVHVTKLYCIYIYICIADNMWECMFLDWVLFMILKGSYCLNIHVLGHAWVHKEIFRISTKVSSR